MNKKQTIILAAGLVALLCVALLARAQSVPIAARYEVGMIKWDGPDKLQLITPPKSEMIRLFKTGVQLPPEIHDQEFCMTWAANKLAQEGWEPIALEGTRILLRRPVVR